MSEKSAHPVFTSFILKILSDLYSRAGMLVLVVFVAREYGVAKFGLFSLAFALVNLFYVVTDAGLHLLTIKNISANPLKSKEYWEKILFLKLLACLISILLILLTMGLLSYSPETWKVAAAAMVWMIANSMIDFINAVFIGLEKLKWVLSNTLFYRSVLYVSAAICFLTDQSLLIFCWILAASSVLGFCSGGVMLSWKIGRFTIQVNRDFIRQAVKEAFPVAAASVLISTYLRTDTVILSKWVGDFQLGLYNSSFKLVEALVFIPATLQSILLPKMVQVMGDTGKLTKTIREAIILAMVMAVPVCLFIALKSKWIITLLYGDQFAESSRILSIMAIGFFGIFLTVIPSILLIAQGRQVDNAIAAFCTLVVSLIANITAAPFFGIWGVAYVMMGTQLLMMGIVTALNRRLILTGPLMWAVGKLFVSALLCASILLYLSSGWEIIETILFFSTFLLLQFVFKILSWRDFKGYFARVPDA